MPRIDAPRIQPLDPGEWAEETRTALAGTLARGGPVANVICTIAQHPSLSSSWMTFANHVLGRANTLPPREREIAILRTGWRCRSEYEFGQHTRIGKNAGLTDEEIKRLTQDGEAPGWSPKDALIVRAADELHDFAFIGDATWAGLADHWSQEQLMDLVFTIGQYTLVSMALNSFGVQLDEGVPGFPE